MKKGTRLYSIFHNKCPHCQEGRFFESDHPFNLMKFDKMGKSCTECGQHFEIETGFYYGAMYASYGINVALFVLFWLLSLFILPAGLNIWWTVAFTTIPSVVLVPLTYRIARLVWINFFVKYEAREKAVTN